MAHLLREFDDSERDYARLVEIHNAVWPEWSETVEGLKAEDAMREKRFFRRRFMWEEDGEVVAYASIGESSWSHEDGKYFVFVVVHPDWQHRGIGARLYDHVTGILSARTPSPVKLVSDTREDLPAAVRFLESRGYTRVQRQEVSRLDLVDFDWERFASARGACERTGLVVRTGDWLLENDPDAGRKLYELDWEIMQDVPVPDPLTKRPFDEWIKEFSHPAFLPESWFVALDGDAYVALSSTWKDLSNSERLYQGLTGVRRPYRRRGIATDLKVRVNDFARDHGVRYIITDNEEKNPMYALNVKLGFERMPGWLVFRKLLSERPRGAPAGDGAEGASTETAEQVSAAVRSVEAADGVVLRSGTADVADGVVLRSGTAEVADGVVPRSGTAEVADG